MTKSRVAFIVANDVVKDNRVMRSIALAVAMGLDVKVFGLGSGETTLLGSVPLKLVRNKSLCLRAEQKRQGPDRAGLRRSTKDDLLERRASLKYLMRTPARLHRISWQLLPKRPSFWTRIRNAGLSARLRAVDRLLARLDRPTFKMKHLRRLKAHFMDLELSFGPELDLWQPDLIHLPRCDSVEGRRELQA